MAVLAVFVAVKKATFVKSRTLLDSKKFVTAGVGTTFVAVTIFLTESGGLLVLTITFVSGCSASWGIFVPDSKFEISSGRVLVSIRTSPIGTLDWACTFSNTNATPNAKMPGTAARTNLL